MITIHCHGNLNDFLPRARRDQDFAQPCAGHETVKNLAETAGVPHPELGALLLNGTPVDFAAVASPGDRLDLYPLDALPALLLPMLRPPLPAPRFVLDTHLGRLAAHLRMLGYDTLYRNDYADDELAQVSHDEVRMLLTRDVGLLKRALVIYGMFVRATDPSEQLREIVRRCALVRHPQAFQRCANCNSLTELVAKDEIIDRIEPRTYQFYDTFRRCPTCERIYWAGSHYQRMAQIADDLFGEK